MISIVCKHDKSLCHNLKLFDNNHYSNHLFDGFSLSHIYYGILYAAIFKKWWAVLIVAIIFEIIENSPLVTNQFRTNGYENYKDSLVNILGDLSCNMLGFLIYNNTPPQYRWVILVVFIINEMVFFSNKDLMEYSAIFLLYKHFKRFFDKLGKIL